MNLLTLVSLGVATMATVLLPAYLDRTRRFTGTEPANTLLGYIALLTPRWVATGVLFYQCVLHGDWGSGYPELVRGGVALAVHSLIGLISFFCLAIPPHDLRAVPSWAARSVVWVGFMVPTAQALFASCYLANGLRWELPWEGAGAGAALVGLGFLVFGAAVLGWALISDLRSQHARLPAPRRARVQVSQA